MPAARRWQSASCSRRAPDFWNIGAALAAPLFDGNALLHQERAARAAYDQAAEQYRSTVLSAFQNVADSLVALQQDAEGLQGGRRMPRPPPRRRWI